MSSLRNFHLRQKGRACVALVCAWSCAHLAHGQVWELDPDFAPEIHHDTSYADAARAFVAPDGRLYLAVSPHGDIGTPLAGPLIRLNADGTRDPDFAAALFANSGPGEIIPLADGRTLVILSIFQPAALPTGRIIRLLANGEIDPGYASLDLSEVPQTARMADGRILLFGEFNRVGATPRNGLARLDVDGTLDEFFAPQITNGRLYVYAAAPLHDGRVYLSGFSSAAVGSNYHLVRLHSDGTLDESFTPEAPGTTYRLFATQPDGSLLLGNGALRRLRPDGTRDDDFPATPAGVESIRRIGVLSDGRIVVEAIPIERGYLLLLLSADGAIVRDFGAASATGSRFDLLAITAADEIVVRQEVSRSMNVGGFIGTITIREDVLFTCLRPDAIAARPLELADAFVFRRPGWVARIEADGQGGVFVSGNFTSIGETRRLNLARFEINGTLDPGFAPDATGVRALELLLVAPDGRPLVRQYFPSTFSGPDSRVVRLNDDGSVDSGFDAPMHAAWLGYRPLWHNTIADGRMLVSFFNSAPNDETHFQLAWLDEGGSATPLNTRFGGLPKFGIVYDGPYPPLEHTHPNPLGQAVGLDDGSVLVWGAFTSVNDTPVAGIARINPDGSLDPTYDLGGYDLPAQPFFDYYVYYAGAVPQMRPDGRTLAVVDTYATGEPVPALVRFLPDGSRDPSFAVLPGLNHGPRLENGYPDLNFPDAVRLPDGEPAYGHTDVGDGTLWVTFASNAGPRLTRLRPREVVAITHDPEPVSVTAGRAAYLMVAIGSTQPASYQWYRNGEIISEATEPVLHLRAAQAWQAGEYSVRIDLAGMTLNSDSVIVSVNPADARLINFSARSHVHPERSPQIIGFVLAGDDSRPVLLRAIGPSLTSFGVSEPLLREPALKLFAGPTATANGINALDPAIVERSNLVGAFPVLPADAANGVELGLAPSLLPGAYTAHNGGTTSDGIALFEFYDAATSPGVLNVSLRGSTAPGADALIGGFVMSGDRPLTLLLRVVGPELTPWQVPDALADPQLTLFRGQLAIASNDNWHTPSAPNAIPLEAAENVTGAFPLTPGGTSAALVAALEPGAYTVHATGVNGTSGEVLLEIYVIDP